MKIEAPHPKNMPLPNLSQKKRLNADEWVHAYDHSKSNEDLKAENDQLKANNDLLQNQMRQLIALLKHKDGIIESQKQKIARSESMELSSMNVERFSKDNQKLLEFGSDVIDRFCSTNSGSLQRDSQYNFLHEMHQHQQ